MIAAIVLAAAMNPDAQFVRSALTFNNGELARAQVALDSTNIPQREYAERVSTDMGTASTQLIAFARHNHVMLDALPNPQPGAPSTAQPPGQTTIAKQRLLAGALAPKRYFDVEIAQESAAIASYEREARDGHDVSIRDFARHALTTLRADLTLARRYLREEPK